MTYIKKLVMHGFKSFAPKTEVLFDKGINVIVGPNGSGKSNVSDALCFALGRLSIKSMRAAKAKNLLFMGSKYMKPAREASVDLYFDNTKRTFMIDSDEVILSRSVKFNGQSTYKINNEVKTRADIVEALAQAGIDPHGFNMVLQGQIQAIVRMHPEERRKIVEEVAGIAIYESRKEKSIHELQKTEERLKEISAVLRERTSFLKNLEREREQALKFKDLEKNIQRCKASILKKKADEKEKELVSLKRSINEKIAQKDKIKSEVEKMQESIEQLNEKIQQINKYIQKATGLEQETLRTQIANLKAELEGLKVRRENYENRKIEMQRRIDQMAKAIPELEKEISELRKKSPLMAKKQEELKKKKESLDRIQEERKAVYTLKTQLGALKERIKDKERQLQKLTTDAEVTMRQLEEMSLNLKYKDSKSCEKFLTECRLMIHEKRSDLESSRNKEIELQRALATAESEIRSAEKIKSQVEKIDTCPLCQSKITEEHINHVFQDSDSKIHSARSLISSSTEGIAHIKTNREKLLDEIKKLELNIGEAERELVRHQVSVDKRDYIKKVTQEQQLIKNEIIDLDKRRESLEQKTTDSSRLEELYTQTLRELEEISSRTEENIDTTLLFKEREVERMHDVIKQSRRDLGEIESEIAELSSSFEEKNKLLHGRLEEEKKLSERFKQMFQERDQLQDKIRNDSFSLTDLQGNWQQIEEQVNYLKVGNAKLEAEKEAIEMEMQEFSGIELIQASLNVLEERLKKAQETIATIGSINMRALEVYDEIKAEYDKVKEKADQIEAEKQEIMKIIEEIDKKKKRTFMKTFNSMNDLFTQNFSKLYSKGVAFLELENQENIFEGGVNIVIRLAKGKYFDVTSLSGGEQTLVALSLLFAIQEYKPYHFYIFDEIDAALDKRNSERLSALLKQYMKAGQYIVVTHNDAIITESNLLYGVSMHDGVSKVLSLKLEDKEESKT